MRFAIVALNLAAFSGGDLFAALDGGGRVSVASLGPMAVIITAEQNAGIQTLGNAYAAITAGGDAWAVAYADLFLDLKAGDDLNLLMARGTLTAYLSVHQEISSIFVENSANPPFFVEKR